MEEGDSMVCVFSLLAVDSAMEEGDSVDCVGIAVGAEQLANGLFCHYSSQMGGLG